MILVAIFANVFIYSITLQMHLNGQHFQNRTLKVSLRFQIFIPKTDEPLPCHAIVLNYCEVWQ